MSFPYQVKAEVDVSERIPIASRDDVGGYGCYGGRGPEWAAVQAIELLTLQVIGLRQDMAEQTDLFRMEAENGRVHMASVEKHLDRLGTA